MDNIQAGILASLPKPARYLSFSLDAGSKPARLLTAPAELADGDSIVVGLRQSLVRCSAPAAGLVIPLSVVAHAPFIASKAMVAGDAFEWIEVNHAEQIIP